MDESYLPRYIGYTFGALLLLNHFVGSDLSSITSAQLVSNFLSKVLLNLVVKLIVCFDLLLIFVGILYMKLFLTNS